MNYQILVLVQFTCASLLVFTGPIIASNSLLLVIELAAVGLGLWALSKNKIGNFNISPNIKRNSRLIMSGPYQFIRHPMYATLLLGTLTIVLDNFSLMRIWIWIVLVASIIKKLLIEERLLAQRFKRYASYKRRTKRLFPLLF